MTHRVSALPLALLVVLLSRSAAYPCSLVSIVPEPALARADLLVVGSDLIVRVIAAEYERPPAKPEMWTNGEPDSRVRFRIVEVVKGVESSKEIVLPAFLVDRDDFNDRPVPYDFVRPGGRSGSCFANFYRRGGQFLLMLKRLGSGSYTVDWSPLAPVNEQLRSENDDWVVWIRTQIRRNQLDEPDLSPARLTATYTVYGSVIKAMTSGAIQLRAPVGDHVAVLGRTVTSPDRGEALQSAAIPAALRSDFNKASTLQQPVVRRLDIPQTYELLPISAPAANVHLALSPVGFTADLSRALVYVHFAAGPAGNGFYAVLSRRSGSWAIDRVIPVWTVGR